MATLLQDVGRHFLIGRVVFREKNVQRHALRSRAGNRSRKIGGRLFRQRQIYREMECASFPHLTLDPDGSVHQFHQILGDRKPEPGASKTPAHGSICLGERPKEIFQRVRRDADPRIAHSEFQTRFFILRRDTKAHFHLAPLGELDRIAD